MEFCGRSCGTVCLNKIISIPILKTYYIFTKIRKEETGKKIEGFTIFVVFISKKLSVHKLEKRLNFLDSVMFVRENLTAF